MEHGRAGQDLRSAMPRAIAKPGALSLRFVRRVAMARGRSTPFRGPAGALVSGAAALILAAAGPAAMSAQQAATVAPSLVFDGVTVVDVEQGKLIPGQRVVIVGNRIQAVGAVRTVKTPKGAQVVEARGKYLIPGLWDMHAHSAADPSSHLLFLANGVTGIRDAWSNIPLDTMIRWQQEILAGTRVGPPRQLLSGRPISKSDGDGVRQLAESLKARGATFLKYYPQGNTSFVAVAALRRVGLPFGGHVWGVSAIEASDSGMSILDHVNTAGDLDQLCWSRQASVARCRPVAERFRKNNTWWVPTLAIGFGDPQEPWAPISRAVRPRFRQFSDDFWDGSAALVGWLRSVMNVTVSDSHRMLSIVQRVGLPVLAGTDMDSYDWNPPGFSLHVEIALYAAEGMSPLEALQTATLNPAKLLRATDSLGTVAAGKLADLVLLDANPLEDITNTTTIRAVVANGRYFNRTALDQVLTDVRTNTKQKPPK